MKKKVSFCLKNPSFCVVLFNVFYAILVAKGPFSFRLKLNFGAVFSTCFKQCFAFPHKHIYAKNFYAISKKSCLLFYNKSFKVLNLVKNDSGIVFLLKKATLIYIRKIWKERILPSKKWSVCFCFQVFTMKIIVFWISLVFFTLNIAWNWVFQANLSSYLQYSNKSLHRKLLLHYLFDVWIGTEEKSRRINNSMHENKKFEHLMIG